MEYRQFIEMGGTLLISATCGQLGEHKNKSWQGLEGRRAGSSNLGLSEEEFYSMKEATVGFLLLVLCLVGWRGCLMKNRYSDYDDINND